MVVEADQDKEEFSEGARLHGARLGDICVKFTRGYECAS